MTERARILVVDDEPDILAGIATLLQGALRVEVVEVATGAAGLEALKGGRFDLVLADYKMPGMDGMTFLAEAQKAAPTTPRIMMTAYPDLDLAIRALNEARILHFFTKPLEPERLIDVVRTVLDVERALRFRDAALKRSIEEMRRRTPSK